MKGDKEIEREEKLWQNELDLKKSLMTVHDTDFRKILGEDFKLGKLDNTEISRKQRFVMDFMGIARLGLDLCPHPDYAIEIYNMDMMYAKGLAILSFNVDDNMFVDRATSWQQNKEEEGTEGITEDKLLDRWKKRMGKNKLEEQG